jgi:3-hydroxyacyl-CoA dehydrogenase / enoyl-CoA hydratase / 3-hydroxybutyryl-CoA epimerase
VTALHVAVAEGVAVITFDLPGETINKFTASVIAELTALLDRFDQDQGIRAAVLCSAKPDIWIAGADIEAFLDFKDASDAERTARAAQQLVDRLERSRVPLVCAIHGACLGGGLELALAAAYRIASDHPKTALGLPETQLGIIPGIGGTQRLPRTVGLTAALDMILTAKQVRARKALSLGLVDELVHPAILRQVALARAQELASGKRSRTREARKGGASALLLEDNPLGRAVVFRQAREQALKKSRGHYPAVLAAIEAVAAGYEGSREQGYATEARLFGQMAATAVSKELVFLFFATTSLKKDPGLGDAAVAPRTVQRLGVLGTGFMGAGIAAVAARQGVPVRFKDTKHEAVLKGMAAVRDVLKEGLSKKRITRQEYADQLSLVSGTVSYEGFGGSDLVIEAVFEDVGVKQAVLREVEPLLRPEAVFATNTSTIPIARIAEAAARPERVLGMHFFSPVPKMPLLEVIVTPRTAPEAVSTALQFGRKLGKTVIVVNDAPGFYVNRILLPYMNEAGLLLDEGVAIDAIDAAMLDYGFPVGPITLLDEVGLDVAGKAGKIMADAIGPRLTPSRSIVAVLEAGRLGRKGRSGFYSYDEDGKKGGVDESVYALLPASSRRAMPAAEIVQRLTLAMLNEAARALEEGVLRSARDGDIGAVFGIGFPPFRGGPFRAMDAIGAVALVQQLQALDAVHSGRFVPAALLTTMAAEGRRFYPATGKPVA